MSFSATAREVTTTAEAPSLMPGALPAVTVPPSLKAGRSFASVSIVVSRRGHSSASKVTVAPFLPGMTTGTISSLNLPASIAAIALRWLSTA